MAASNEDVNPIPRTADILWNNLNAEAITWNFYDGWGVMEVSPRTFLHAKHSEQEKTFGMRGKSRGRRKLTRYTVSLELVLDRSSPFICNCYGHNPEIADFLQSHYDLTVAVSRIKFTSYTPEG